MKWQKIQGIIKMACDKFIHKEQMQEIQPRENEKGFKKYAKFNKKKILDIELKKLLQKIENHNKYESDSEYLKI